MMAQKQKGERGEARKAGAEEGDKQGREGRARARSLTKRVLTMAERRRKKEPCWGMLKLMARYDSSPIAI